MLDNLRNGNHIPKHDGDISIILGQDLHVQAITTVGFNFREEFIKNFCSICSSNLNSRGIKGNFSIAYMKLNKHSNSSWCIIFKLSNVIFSEEISYFIGLLIQHRVLNNPATYDDTKIIFL